MDILESIADSFFALNAEGRITFVTARACELLGQPSESVLHRKLDEILSDELESAFYKRITASLADRLPVRFEQFNRRLSRWFEHQTYVSDDGGIAVYGRDITARRRVEDALRASENRLRRFVDANVTGVVIATGSQVTEANDYFLSLVGYTRDDLVRHQIDWTRINFLANRQLDERHETELIRKDGSRVSVLIGSTCIDEVCEETLYVIHDLTQRKCAEMRLRHLVEATKILSSSLDIHRVLNDLARFLVTTVGESCSIYIKEDDELLRVAAATRSIEGEWHADISGSPELAAVLNKGTSERSFHEIIVPLPSRGRIAGAIHLTRRLSPYDNDDLHLVEEIGRRIGISLENTRLYHQTQTANRLKDEFVAALSHELRTPLTPILGAVYMLRAEPQDKRIFAKALDLIERNAKAQSRIVEDLLDLSRIINGKMRLRQDPVDLRNAVQAALDAVRPAQEAKRILVDVQWNSDHGMVSGDPDRLQQIFWNLLSNSVKFTPNGGRIRVELAQDGEQAEVRVTDTGIGIAQEFLPYVFDRFRQENTSRTRMHGGMGLGLAMVRHLVEAHGGTVDAHSLGDRRGSTFVVRLPMLAATVPEVRTRSASITG
jgi:PAS domain S-box-containing protein